MVLNKFNSTFVHSYTLTGDAAKVQTIVKTCPSGDYDNANRCLIDPQWAAALGP